MPRAPPAGKRTGVLFPIPFPLMPSNVTTIGPQTQTHADRMFDAVFERSGHFRIEMPYEDAQQFIRRIEEYNEFRAANVLHALETADRLIPRNFYGEGNPNNGSRSYTVSVGREGSPVIHLERYEFGDETRMDEVSMKLLCREMELVGKADEADYEIRELHVLNGRKITFRFWWD